MDENYEEIGKLIVSQIESRTRNLQSAIISMVHFVTKLPEPDFSESSSKFNPDEFKYDILDIISDS